MPNKTKSKATKKPAAPKAAARPVKGAKPKKASSGTQAVSKNTVDRAAKPAKPVKPTAAEKALARAAAKAALKAEKKLAKAQKAKTRLEERIAAKALAKEARLALKRQMKEGIQPPPGDLAGTKGKGLNLLVAPKGKPKPEKPGRKAKAPKPTRGPQFVAGTVFLPDGFKSREEIQYLFRGAVACVRESLDVAAAEIRAKSEKLQPSPSERELLELARIAEERFRGAIEAAPPNRVIPTKRTFASLVERARARRREIGAFLRGLDLGKTEPSHLDTHSEASLQGLMEWGARLEMLADSAEVDKPDFTQQHRVLDQLESTTEMLVVDVELTLRRYKDRMSARGLELSPLPV
jgi:hypothetical protein